MNPLAVLRMRNAAISVPGEDTVNDFGLPALAYIDSFNASSSLSNYTATQDSSPPAWTITGGECIAVGGYQSQGVLRRNGFSQADAAVQVTTHRAGDAGIVVRFQDQSNFYLLTLSDDSGGNPSANMRLFKRVGGAFTQLGSSVDIAWARGAQKTFRLVASGTSITAYADGVAKIAVTDSSISAAGAIGIRATSGTSQDAVETLAWG